MVGPDKSTEPWWPRGFLFILQNFEPFWRIFYAIGQMFTADCGQKLNGVVIWSHWLRSKVGIRVIRGMKICFQDVIITN